MDEPNNNWDIDLGLTSLPTGRPPLHPAHVPQLPTLGLLRQPIVLGKHVDASAHTHTHTLTPTHPPTHTLTHTHTYTTHTHTTVLKPDARSSLGVRSKPGSGPYWSPPPRAGSRPLLQQL